MAQRPKKNKSQVRYSLILCEGETEVWFFESVAKQLKNRFRPKKSKCRDAENIANEAIKIIELGLKDYEKIYCVFDKDQNTESQLNNANKSIRSSSTLERVYSFPCFEVVFYFAESNNTQDKDHDFISFISKHYLTDKKYLKDKNQIEWVVAQIDLQQLYSNAHNAYIKIGINDNNWKHSVDNQAYSEIFRLIAKFI